MKPETEIKRYLKLLDPLEEAVLLFWKSPHPHKGQYRIRFYDTPEDYKQVLFQRHCSRCGKLLVVCAGLSYKLIGMSPASIMALYHTLQGSVDQLFSYDCDCDPDAWQR